MKDYCIKEESQSGGQRSQDIFIGMVMELYSVLVETGEGRVRGTRSTHHLEVTEKRYDETSSIFPRDQNISPVYLDKEQPER